VVVECFVLGWGFGLMCGVECGFFFFLGLWGVVGFFCGWEGCAGGGGRLRWWFFFTEREGGFFFFARGRGFVLEVLFWEGLGGVCLFVLEGGCGVGGGVGRVFSFFFVWGGVVLLVSGFWVFCFCGWGVCRLFFFLVFGVLVFFRGGVVVGVWRGVAGYLLRVFLLDWP